MNEIVSSLVVVILLSLISTALQEDEFSAEKICSRIANGTFIKDPRACNAWIQCINNTTKSGTCSAGFYDKNTEGCLQGDDIECISSNPCATVGNKQNFTADPYSCNGYYYCDNGNGILGHCSPGMQFNRKILRCVLSYDCQLPMDPNHLCNIVPDGVFIQDNSNVNSVSCSSYQVCWKGKLLSGSCPNGFSFNAFKGLCDYPQNVQCSTSVRIPSEGRCQRAGEFLPDNRTCSGYYYCKEDKNGLFLVWGKCSAGRFFNPIAGGSCIDRTQIVCQYDRCNGVQAKGIHLVNISNDDCKGFAICQNGVQISSGLSPNGLFFDEINQKFTSEVVSYPACRSNKENIHQN